MCVGPRRNWDCVIEICDFMFSPEVTEVTVFRDLRRCSLIASYQRVGGTCCCCLQGTLQVTALLQHWNWFVRNIWRSLAVLKRRCRLFRISRKQWSLIGYWECTRVGTLIVATIYLQLIQNRYMFRSFTVLHCSHQHCVQPVAGDVEVVGYL